MVRLIIWIVIGLLALSFFGVSLEALYNSPTNQDNLSFIGRMLRDGWEVVRVYIEPLIDLINEIIPDQWQ